ncbi:MAG: hypothetical protein ACQEV6_07640 [Pseudomonadota bacterium]
MAHQPPGADGAPEGITRATVVDEGDISAMSAMVLDAPQPALMIRYQGEEVLTVYDSDNEPFLRFKDDRVEAHVHSAHWQNLPQSQGFEVGEDTHWVQVSGSGNFGWVDPRLVAAEGGHPGETTQWRIPVRRGEQEISAITGRLSWRPIVTQSTESGH